MWIELHQSLPTSRKIMKLKRELTIKKPTAIGHIVLVWLWALDNAMDGDLSEFTDEDIAEVAEWPEKTAGAFVEALVGAGFLDRPGDGSLLIHNWEKYAGRLIDQNEIKRQQAAERQRRRREKLRENPDLSRVTVTQDSVTEGVTEKDLSRVSNAPTKPNLTIPNQTYIYDDISAKKDVEKSDFVEKPVENPSSGMDWARLAISAYKLGSMDADGKKSYLRYAQRAYEEQKVRIDFATLEVKPI